MQIKLLRENNANTNQSLEGYVVFSIWWSM